MPRIKLRIKALVVTGNIRTRVILKNVRVREAPDMRLDSSSAGSMARNASTINRKRNGVEYCIMCQTTPPHEKTFTRGSDAPVSHFHARLIEPTWGYPACPRLMQ